MSPQLRVNTSSNIQMKIGIKPVYTILEVTN